MASSAGLFGDSSLGMGMLLPRSRDKMRRMLFDGVVLGDLNVFWGLQGR